MIHYNPVVGTAMPLQDDTKPHGLGFDFDDVPDHRQSTSDDSTVEVTTPVTMRILQGSHQSHESHELTAELTSPPPILAAFMPTGSTDTSPASQQSAGEQSEDGEFHACIPGHNS